MGRNDVDDYAPTLDAVVAFDEPGPRALRSLPQPWTLLYPVRRQAGGRRCMCRNDRIGATLVTSQLDPTAWHAVIGDATVADAICDRLIHGAHRLTLHGESLRKPKAALTPTEKSEK